MRFDLSSAQRTTLLFVARLLLASLPAFGGIEKLFKYQDAVGFATAFQIPFARYTMVMAIALELGCAVALLIPRTCRPAAAILVGWTLFLGVWFHRFWLVPDAQWQEMIDSFFHHLVMAGGFLLLAIVGPNGRGREIAA